MRRGAGGRTTRTILVAVTVLTTGCVAASLDTARLERQLATDVEARLQVDGVTVRCPGEVEVRRGDAFECVATAPDDERVAIRVTQVDDDGTVTWEIAWPDG